MQNARLFDARIPIERKKDEERWSRNHLIFTGIEEVGSRGDFLDRCLLLHLPAISDEERRTEKAFWEAFEVAHPLILGALLDAVSLPPF